MATKATVRRTRKPCPGCGEVVESRRADEVCYECAQMIEAGRRYAKTQKRKFGKPFSIPSSSHGLPLIYQADHKMESRFKGAFFDLCIAVSVQPAKSTCPAEPLFRNFNNNWCGEYGAIYLEPANRDNLRELYTTVQAIADEAYARGKANGEKFIGRLCSGEISLAKLNEETTKGESG